MPKNLLFIVFFVYIPDFRGVRVEFESSSSEFETFLFIAFFVYIPDFRGVRVEFERVRVSSRPFCLLHFCIHSGLPGSSSRVRERSSEFETFLFIAFVAYIPDFRGVRVEFDRVRCARVCAHMAAL